MALLADVVRRRDVLWSLVERELRIRTKRSWIGVVWPAVAPFFLLALYVFVFRRVFDVPIERYPEFLLAGLLPWSLLAQSLGQAVRSLSDQADLIRRARFPHAFLPITTVVVMTLYFLGSLAAFLVYLAWHGRLDYAVLPVLVVPIASVVLFVSAVSMVAAYIDVYNRDLRQVLGNLLTIWFFLVPIVYRHDMAPSAVRFLRSVDPMNVIVGQFRDVLYYGAVSRPPHVPLLLLWTAGVFLVVLLVFNRLARDLPKDV